MRVVSAVVPVRPAPACTVRASPGEIAAELTAHVLIMPVTVAIVAVDPHVPPAVAMMPRRSMPAYPMRMATVLDPTGAPLARAGLDFAAVDFDRRRRCVLFGWLPGRSHPAVFELQRARRSKRKTQRRRAVPEFCAWAVSLQQVRIQAQHNANERRGHGKTADMVAEMASRSPGRSHDEGQARRGVTTSQAIRRCGRLTSRLGMLIG